MNDTKQKTTSLPVWRIEQAAAEAHRMMMIAEVEYRKRERQYWAARDAAEQARKDCGVYKI